MTSDPNAGMEAGRPKEERRKGRGGGRSDGKPGPEALPQSPRFFFAYVALALLALWLWQDAARGLAYRTIPYSEFKQALARGEVLKVSIEDDRIEGELRPAGPEGAAPSEDEWGEEEEPEPGEPVLFLSLIHI